MKIAYVTSEFVIDGIGGGQANYLSNVASLMSQHGHRVYIIVKGKENSRVVWRSNIEVITVDCALNNPFISKLLGRYQISFFINLRVIVLNKKLRFDVIQFSNLNGIPLLMNKNLPSVIRLSDFSPACDMALEEFYDLERLVISKKEMQRFKSFQKARVIFAPSKVCADLTSQIINRHIEVIESPLCINDNIVKPPWYDKRVGTSDYILFFGSLNFLKGLHVLCDIADEYLDKYPDKKILFMGGPQQLTYNGMNIDSNTYIERRITRNKDKIILLGAIREREYINYIIYNSRLCVMPSRIDNLPNTCIEAMALGKIVVGTYGASFDQLITDGFNGFLIQIDNSPMLLEKMITATNMLPEDYEKMCEEAKKTIRRMDNQTIYKKMMKIYDAVIKNAK